MPDFIIYGKIIIDDVRLADGSLARSVLGGGGPQSAFGARLWSRSVGFLSRTGYDMEQEHFDTLNSLGFDTAGVFQYDDILTPRTVMQYDENEYTMSTGHAPKRDHWDRLLAQVLTLPEAYRKPRAIHLVTESYDEPMVDTALELKAQGALFTLEPIISQVQFRNEAGMRELFKHVDLISPDWPSSSGMAKSDKPVEVVKHLASLGPKMVAVRHGANGSYVWDSTHDEIWHVPPYPVTPVDPTGAGNSYSGGQCAGWTLTGDARLAGCHGSVSASFLVERIGFPQMNEAVEAEAQQRLARMIDMARKL